MYGGIKFWAGFSLTFSLDIEVGKVKVSDQVQYKPTSRELSPYVII